jgi:dihydropyrimidinase
VSVAAVVGGTVVTPTGARRTDVMISGGTIAEVGDAGPVAGLRVDASDCYVLPGGVDPHCHFMGQVGPATRAAAIGGTTTALSFTNPEPGQGDIDCMLSRRAELAAAGAVIDVGLHAMVYDPDHITASDLAAAKRAGAAAIKIFLAYPELGIMCSPRRLFELMTEARELGLLVQVHCENGSLIEALADRLMRAGQSGPGLFAAARPPEVEEEAVATTLAVAALTGAPCYLVHLSSVGAIDQVRLARARCRSPVHAEVCLHHLIFDDRRYTGADAERYLVAPPLRPREHVEGLWQAVADGTVDAIGSDHCQTRSAVTGGIAAAAKGCHYGIAGIGARLPVLLSEGLSRGVPIGRIVELASANPARIFGHYPRKGALMAGSDADIVVFEPGGETDVGPDAFDDGTGPSVYAGYRRRGRIRTVVLSGQLIVDDGVLVDQPGLGRYLPAESADQ